MRYWFQRSSRTPKVLCDPDLPADHELTARRDAAMAGIVPTRFGAEPCPRLESVAKALAQRDRDQHNRRFDAQLNSYHRRRANVAPMDFGGAA